MGPKGGKGERQRGGRGQGLHMLSVSRQWHRYDLYCPVMRSVLSPLRCSEDRKTVDTVGGV